MYVIDAAEQDRRAVGEPPPSADLLLKVQASAKPAREVQSVRVSLLHELQPTQVHSVIVAVHKVHATKGVQYNDRPNHTP